MNKLWSVKVTMEFDIPVAAASKEAAEEIAARHYREDPGIRAPRVSLLATKLAEVPRDFKGCQPWRSDEDRSLFDGWTCELTLKWSEATDCLRCGGGNAHGVPGSRYVNGCPCHDGTHPEDEPCECSDECLVCSDCSCCGGGGLHADTPCQWQRPMAQAT